MFMVHLRHDLQGPTVPHTDGLGGVSGDLAVLLGRSQQGRPEHRRQVVERHLVDAFLLCHPEEKTTARLNQKRGANTGSVTVTLLCSD